MSIWAIFNLTANIYFFFKSRPLIFPPQHSKWMIFHQSRGATSLHSTHSSHKSSISDNCSTPVVWYFIRKVFLKSIVWITQRNVKNSYLKSLQVTTLTTTLKRRIQDYKHWCALRTVVWPNERTPHRQQFANRWITVVYCSNHTTVFWGKSIHRCMKIWDNGFFSNRIFSTVVWLQISCSEVSSAQLWIF